jgi:hypothetical protein
VFQPLSPIQLASIVAAILDDLDIPYVVGGAVASTILGEPRSTEDLDVVADITLDRVPALIARLKPDFYVPDGLVEQAVRRRTSFNVIHQPSVRKVDIFVMKGDDLGCEEMARRRLLRISDEPVVDLWVATPEDTVLQKLLWYRKGGEVSDRQWRDVLGVLKVQGDRLDLAYLRRWVAALHLEDLWQRAERQAGLFGR